jgi:hypothetical protein
MRFFRFVTRAFVTVCCALISAGCLDAPRVSISARKLEPVRLRVHAPFLDGPHVTELGCASHDLALLRDDVERLVVADAQAVAEGDVRAIFQAPEAAGHGRTA